MQLEGQLPVPVLHLLPQGWKLQVQLLQAPEGVVWRWWQMGCGKVVWVGVGWRIWGNVILLPSGAHIDLLSLILPVLLQFSQALPFPVTELPSSVS